MARKKQRHLKCHLETIEDTFKELGTNKNGLTERQARDRLKEYGPNKLPKKKIVSIWLIILNQIKNPLIYILIAAGIISVLTQEIRDAVFIFFVIVLNTFLGTYQEWKAEKGAQSLENYLKKKIAVIRKGDKKNIDVKELVPGDIVFIESGDHVPADMRLVEVSKLKVDEALLTGESAAVSKNTEAMEKDKSSSCSNMIFAGTTVTSGRGLGVVVNTGLETEVGKIAEAVYSSKEVKPPLLIRMDRFAKKIGFIILGASALIALVALYQGYEYIEVFLIAVALAVAVLPEGLPIGVTVALSIATNRMARKNVIIRKLAAVESLGSCTLIASDKTGTLTLNKQTVKGLITGDGKEFEVTGEGYNDQGEIKYTNKEKIYNNKVLNGIAKICILDNEASLFKEDDQWNYDGDAVEVALLSFALKAGFTPEEIREHVEIMGEIPFESGNKFSAKYFKENGNLKVAIKGAAEVILPLCKKTKTDQGTEEIDEEGVYRNVKKLTDQGLRVIAVAEGYPEKRASYKNLGKDDLPPLIFMGLLGFLDPIRQDVKQSVKKSQEAGIRVLMITGDHPQTAFSIAKKLNIVQNEKEVVTGQELSRLNNKGKFKTEDKEKLKNFKVFARVSPMQKLRIVETFKKAGHFVAVTGDGVNDAPALKSASIGVAMGSGTDVAKDTASIIVTDNSFSSIVSGIEEGRFAYDNIRKVTYFLISTGVGLVLLFVVALFSGLPIALLAIQLLWIKVVTDSIQDAALAFEGGEPGAMKRKPRDPKEGIFNRQMIEQTLLSGLTMAAISLGLWFYLISNGWEIPEARNLLLLLVILMQNFHAFNCRSERESTFKIPIKRNYFLIIGVITAQLIHIISLYIPAMQQLLRTNPVSITQWLTLLSLASIMIWVMEIFKMVKRKQEVRK
ncbi:MAG: cation-translocating P-type ATPase [Elusimicrobiota bacterium]